MITILNSNGATITHFDNVSPEGNPYFEPVMTENIESLVSGFSFSVPLELSDSQFLTGLNKVLARDKDNDLRLFTIIDTYESFTQDGEAVIRVDAEDFAITEMNNTIVSAFNARSMEEALNNTFTASGWKIEYARDSWQDSNIDKSFILTEPDNMRSVLQQLIETYELEFKFTAEKDIYNRVKRVAKVYRNRGVQSGKYFTYDRDVLSIEREIDYSNIRTAIYPYFMKDNKVVDLKGWTSVTPQEGFSKDKESPLVVFNDAHKQWDEPNQYKVMVFRQDVNNQNELLYRAACAEIIKYNAPKYTYTVNVLLLANLEGWDGEEVNIGDNVWLKERVGETEIGLEARVIEYEYHEDDPSQDKVTFTNFVEINTYDSADIAGIREALNNLQGQVNDQTVILEGFGDDIAGLTSGQEGIINDLNGKNSVSVGDTPKPNPIQGDTWFTVERNEHGQDIQVIKVYNATTQAWEPRMDSAKAFEALDKANEAQADATTSLEAANNAVEQAGEAYTLASSNAAKIVLMDEAINLRVEKNDVINQINVSSEGIIISGAKVQITGSTFIEDAVIKDAAIASVTASKLTAGTIDASLINVTNINASELKAGTIQGIDIQGSKFTNPFSVDNQGTTLTGNTIIEGAEVKIEYSIGTSGRTGKNLIHPQGYDTRILASDGTAEQYASLQPNFISLKDSAGNAGTITAENLTEGIWYNLPLQPGYSTAESNTPQFRKYKNLDGTYTVEFRGQITGTLTTAGGVVMAVVPSGYRPPKTTFAYGGTNNGNGGRLAVTTSGNFRFDSQTGSSPTYAAISAMTYRI